MPQFDFNLYIVFPFLKLLNHNGSLKQHLTIRDVF
ncbi:hypothetical protein SAMN05443633_104354 [Chryseobacterium arachidis]|uniref:Uncharacterized protein n=1 Tax=Chryseobacterium arachidis TaxID=1416778 RepID=A0A1M5C0E8_9FLAO|nr:hypothetical protein SAMN05443633_104354 [Chryseobacterium arachidis]